MNTDNRPPPYSMRLDPDLRAKLEAVAKANGRSLHAEISMRLDSSLIPDPHPMRINAEGHAQILAAGLNPNRASGQAESRMIAYLQEKGRQQEEEAKRKPVQIEDKSEVADTKDKETVKTTKRLRRPLIDTESDERQRKQEQERLQSETDFERLLRRATGAVELKKLGIQVEGGYDEYKWNFSAMGLPRPLMNSTDVATALEDTILRTICTVLNDVVKDLMVEIVKEQFAKAGITLPPDDESEKEKGEGKA